MLSSNLNLFYQIGFDYSATKVSKYFKNFNSQPEFIAPQVFVSISSAFDYIQECGIHFCLHTIRQTNHPTQRCSVIKKLGIQSMILRLKYFSALLMSPEKFQLPRNSSTLLFSTINYSLFKATQVIQITQKGILKKVFVVIICH